LAVVVDDAAQGITDIVRGADLIDSTTRQVFLQRLLGLPTPTYAHLPAALNDRGEKLSKQTFAPAVDPEKPVAQLVAALDFLNQSPPQGLAQANVDTVWQWAIENWRLERVPRTRGLPAK